ncbi:MAG TPA: restriction endonuclease [Epulopiscium sp.]|nr:restriction endonuclease [Candidatus Epulonipiscium sp.]
MTSNLYDKIDPDSIYQYATNLIGKTFNQICEEDTLVTKETENKDSYEAPKRKGGLGELVEERYFKYKANNDSEPDFKEAGVELKVTPYRMNKNGTISSKERMILTMIDYYEIAKTDFYENNLWKKCQLILIVVYLWEKELESRLDYMINYVFLYSPPVEDLKIIIDDYNLIKDKVSRGKAHELSEGDTIYLGAATKAATSADRRKQPFSDIMAKPRAFSFKNSYMTYILRDYVAGQDKRLEKIVDDLKEDTFEQYVLKKFNRYIGVDRLALIKELYEPENEKEINVILRAKSLYSNLAFRMLGIKSNRAEEFEKANIVVKTVRIRLDGTMKESLSFPAFKIKELVNEIWEDSKVYNYFESTKFLFVIFREKSTHTYNFEKAFFWNMPSDDLENKLQEDWLRFKNKFRAGICLEPRTLRDNKLIVNNDLPKKTDTNMLHVRPHAAKAAHLINGVKYGSGILERDADELLNGDMMTKQSFWLNNDYIAHIVNKG